MSRYHDTISTRLRPRSQSQSQSQSQTANTSTSTSSSVVERFPLLSDTQYKRLDLIIQNLSPDANTWAQFNKVKDKLRLDDTKTDNDEEEEEDIYSISLKLIFQPGQNWKEKWDNVVKSYYSASGNSNQFDLLKKKLDKVATTPPTRPHSTPPTRQFLIQRTTTSSTSEDEDVPTLQDLALARQKKKQRAIQSTPRAHSRHPLLERRLQEISFIPPQPRFNRSTPTRNDHDDDDDDDELDFELETKALKFRRLNLLSRHFDSWFDFSNFLTLRQRSVDRARQVWLIRCSLQDWKRFARKLNLLTIKLKEFESSQEKKKRDEEGLLLKNCLEKWRLKLKDREKHHRQDCLRNSRNQLLKLCKQNLIKSSLNKWKFKTSESLAFKFRTSYLAIRSIRHWKLQLSKIESLESIALQFRKSRLKTNHGFKKWKICYEFSSGLKLFETRVDSRLKLSVLSRWSDRTKFKLEQRRIQSLAIDYCNRSRIKISLTIWKDRLNNLNHLGQQALVRYHDERVIKFMRNQFKLWYFYTLSKKFDEKRLKVQIETCFVKWIDKFDFVQIELNNGLMIQKIESNKNSKLLMNTFRNWSQLNRRRNESIGIAIQFTTTRTLDRSLVGWKSRLERHGINLAKSLVVREFFLQRNSWRKWFDRFENLKREKWLTRKIDERKKKVLSFWVYKTLQSNRDRKSLEIFNNKSRTRRLKTSLSIWQEQVILRKEVLLETEILYQSRLIETNLKRWIDKFDYVNRELGRNKLAKFQELKLEELRDSKFHQWLFKTRRMSEIKRNYDTLERDKNLQRLENCFDVWRDKRLSRFEKEIEQTRERRMVKNSFENWKHSTVTLTAFKVYRENLLKKNFKDWKRWTPSIELTVLSIRHDQAVLLRCTIQRWSLKTSFKRAFRNSSGRLSTPRSIHPPSQISSNDSPSSRLNPIRPSSPLPPSLERSPPSTSSSDYSSSSYSPLVTTTTTQSSSLFTTNSTRATASMPSSSSFSHPNRLVRTPSAAPTSSRPRHDQQDLKPRLSQDYIAQGRTTRIRRTNSVTSLVTTRSAPPPPRHHHREIESDVETMSNGNGEEDGERGVRRHSTTTSMINRARRRMTTRSEGGRDDGYSTKDEEEDRGNTEKRDVRKGYEALRDRLRAAATLSK